MGVDGTHRPTPTLWSTAGLKEARARSAGSSPAVPPQSLVATVPPTTGRDVDCQQVRAHTGTCAAQWGIGSLGKDEKTQQGSATGHRAGLAKTVSNNTIWMDQSLSQDEYRCVGRDVGGYSGRGEEGVCPGQNHPQPFWVCGCTFRSTRCVAHRGCCSPGDCQVIPSSLPWHNLSTSKSFLLYRGWAGAWWAVGGLSAAAVWTTYNLVRCVCIVLFAKLRALGTKRPVRWETARPTLATANTLARPPTWCAY